MRNFLTALITSGSSDLVLTLAVKEKPRTNIIQGVPQDLRGEHGGPGDLEHGVGLGRLRLVRADEGDNVGGAQQRDQDQQRLAHLVLC